VWIAANVKTYRIGSGFRVFVPDSEVAEMSVVNIRPFRRSDRDQVTGLVNQHIGSVIPGCSVSVNAVLSQLEREPHEMIIDPWVSHREAWVAEYRESIVAAALLHAYADDEQVSEQLRNHAEIRWFVARPAWWTGDPAERDLGKQTAEFLAQLVRLMRSWGPNAIGADPSLPAPGVYGVPDVWPHVRQLLSDVGFQPVRSELVYLAAIGDLAVGGPAPIAGLTVRRDVGSMSTRFVGDLNGSMVGFVEVNSDLTVGGLRSQFAGIADIDNVYVEPEWRRRGVATWLLGHVADWLRLGRADRVLNYADADDPAQDAYRTWLAKMGWQLLTRTQRNWQLT
jgi:GNAT superfamily N-acetyltransferase